MELARDEYCTARCVESSEFSKAASAKDRVPVLRAPHHVGSGKRSRRNDQPGDPL